MVYLGTGIIFAGSVSLRPSDLVVDDPILKRFGWWKVGASLDQAVWMGKVVETIWSQMYPKGDG